MSAKHSHKRLPKKRYSGVGLHMEEILGALTGMFMYLQIIK
jgi:hypothetical protein